MDSSLPLEPLLPELTSQLLPLNLAQFLPREPAFLRPTPLLDILPWLWAPAFAVDGIVSLPWLPGQAVTSVSQPPTRLVSLLPPSHLSPQSLVCTFCGRQIRSLLGWFPMLFFFFSPIQNSFVCMEGFQLQAAEDTAKQGLTHAEFGI